MLLFKLKAAAATTSAVQLGQKPHLRCATIAMLATFMVFSTIAGAETVRDHRTNKGGSYNTSNTPPPSVNKKPVTDKKTNNGGVTVTSKPRKKTEKACIVGTRLCTTNETTVKILKGGKK